MTDTIKARGAAPLATFDARVAQVCRLAPRQVAVGVGQSKPQFTPVRNVRRMRSCRVYYGRRQRPPSMSKVSPVR
jgi:hypothetical protein